MNTISYQPYDDPRFKFITNDSYIFETEERAQLHCKMWNEHWAAMKNIEAVQSVLTRSAYEDACAYFGVPAMSDAECDSYGVRYGEFKPWLDGDKIGGYTPAYCVQMALALRRLRGIEQERQAQPKPKARPVAQKLCDCGHYAAHPMSASRGTACPDCYDRMSE